MYTRCPHCTTIFQVTAEQLRLAQGDLSCVTCTQSFNALELLANDVQTLIAALSNPDTENDESPDGADPEQDEADDCTDQTDDDETTVEETFNEEDTRDQPRPDLSDIEPEYADEAEITGTDDENVSPDRKLNEPTTETTEDSGAGEIDDGTLEYQTDDQGEWKMFLAELDDDPSDEATAFDHPSPAEEADPFDNDLTSLEESFDADDDDIDIQEVDTPSFLPPWLADESADEPPQQGRKILPSWYVLGAVTALALLLAGQLTHYNRDALAAHATYGDTVRNIYALLGTPLYPDWPLAAFEVTGTEAIAGRSNQDALDVLANVIVTGRQPVGLPLIRIVLIDRWANPIASRVFEPHEYLHDFDPANTLIRPGSALPVEVSVADPGTAAMGYIIDVCLPHRTTGLDCQIARDPFK
jgi:predicted Zn finger-like uncharacterized protein